MFIFVVRITSYIVQSSRSLISVCLIITNWRPMHSNSHLWWKWKAAQSNKVFDFCTTITKTFVPLVNSHFFIFSFPCALFGTPHFTICQKKRLCQKNIHRRIWETNSNYLLNGTFFGSNIITKFPLYKKTLILL